MCAHMYMYMYMYMYVVTCTHTRLEEEGLWSNPQLLHSKSVVSLGPHGI